jgi:hypothetical protein
MKRKLIAFSVVASIAMVSIVKVSAQESIPPETCNTFCDSKPDQNNGKCKQYTCSNGLPGHTCEETMDSCKDCVRPK